jgi:predicted nicotinamide N-methyase
VWDSSQVLAQLMLDYDIEGKRILELGCGIALSSLLLNRRGANITSTDYHPEAEAYLRTNTRLNEDRDIPFFLADWDAPAIDERRFDLIIGSDVLYENYQLAPLARFIEQHAAADCEVIVVDPGRKQQGGFRNEMSQYGFACVSDQPQNGPELKKRFKGAVLTFNRCPDAR